MIIWKPENDRGQVSLDYIIGITIFIVAFLFMYNILTSLLLPFQINSDEIKPMAERVSIVLVESSNGLALRDTTPNIIDRTKVSQLNDDLNNTAMYETMLIKYGLTKTNINYNMHVSLRYFNNTLYPSAFFPLLNSGPTPDDFSNVGQTERVVFLYPESQRLILQVKVWL